MAVLTCGEVMKAAPAMAERNQLRSDRKGPKPDVVPKDVQSSDCVLQSGPTFHNSTF